MKLSDYIAKFLWEQGCTHVFGYPGGAVTHILDSIYGTGKLQFVLSHHEQAAAFAAEGYARTTNNIGVAIATSGPGATNLITGIGSSFFDSIPCLYLTGQVNTYEYKKDEKLRQAGFQETDIVSIAKPITKYAVRLTDPSQIRFELEKAVAIARTGRKGPVLIDIPMDIQRAQIDEHSLSGYPVIKNPDCRREDVRMVVNELKSAKRPVILAGGGIRLSGGIKVFRELADRMKIPVVCTLMGKDACEHSKEYFCGMIGTYGNRYANLTAANADLILALGTRLDTRQTGTDPESFAREAKLIRIEVDRTEIEHKLKQDEYSVNADLSTFLSQLNHALHQIHEPYDWIQKTNEYKRLYPTYRSKEFSDPNYMLSVISEMMEENDVICTDVGQNQMWAAQSLCISKNQRFITSGGMGAMGFCVPAAIGAFYGMTDGNIYALTGDGGFQMNIQELELLKRNNIPIKIIVLNNHCLGMIRHFQELYFDHRYHATISDYSAPDFCKLAKAYGIDALKVNSLRELDSAKEVLKSRQPAVIELNLPQFTHVHPRLSLNRPIEEQEPLPDNQEFLNNMIVKPYPSSNNEGDAYKDFVTSQLESFKCKNHSDLLKLIPIRKTGTEETTGYLWPITKNYKETMPECISLFTKWRNENSSISLESFTATEASTEKWLDNAVLKNTGRILFVIAAKDGRKIGHIGFSSFDYGNKCCEIDAVIRGETSGYKGMMSFALNALIGWGIESLMLEDICLRVRNDNDRAIRYYLRNEFEQMPIDWESKAEIYYIKMKLDIQKWKEKYHKGEDFENVR